MGISYIQGSTLAGWEILLLVQSYKARVSAVARHLKWPEAKVQAAINYARAFPEEIESALSENAAIDFEASCVSSQAVELMGEPRDESVLLVQGKARDSHGVLRKELSHKRHKKHKTI